MPDDGRGTTRERAAALAALALSGEALRNDCPAADEIAAWHEKRLPEAEMAHVQAHVAGCDRCYSAWVGMLGLLEIDAASQPARQPQRSRWRIVGLAGVAAAVIAVVLVPIQIGTIRFASSPIPGYELSLRGTAVVRGDIPVPIDEVVQLTVGNTFELRLTPATAVEGPVDVRTLLDVGGTLTPLTTPAPTIREQGLVIIEGQIGTAIVFPPGRSDLVVVVGRRKHMPADQDLRNQLQTQDAIVTDQWNAWKVSLLMDE